MRDFLTSSFFSTCHLGLVSPFHRCVTPCRCLFPALFARHNYICNQAQHRLGYVHILLTLVCLLLLLPPPPSLSHLCFKAVISAVQCALPILSPTLSALMPFPIIPLSFALSLHRHPPLPSLSLSDKAINSTCHV